MQFSKNDVKIIGVHTPETKSERDASRVQSKTSEAKLNFSVAIDNDKKTWNAWGNNCWPTVYLMGGAEHRLSLARHH